MVQVDECLKRLTKTLELLDEKDEIIEEMREAADEYSELCQALEDERSARARLMEERNALEESHSIDISSLVKERDRALAHVELLKKSNHELQKEVTKEKSRLPIMPIIEVPCSTNSICEHGDLIEENKRLKEALDKGLVSCIQGEKNLNDLLSNQRDNVTKEGLGFVRKSNKKKNNKKKKKNAPSSPSNVITFVKEGEKVTKDKGKSLEVGVSGVAMTGVSAPSHKNINDNFNPSYVLCRDYNGQVYAKYVGPFDGYIEWAIWVPKILVTNIQGPIRKWVPKYKN